MEEVKHKRYSGPFDKDKIPYKTGYLVNPCGLVPKSVDKTRLINHYSYPDGSSVNDYINDDYSKVKYQDVQDAVRISLQLLKDNPQAKLHYAKTDASSAFRVLCIHKDDRQCQMLKAENPLSGKMVYFIDLCCGYGSSSSCFLYDKLSRALRHLYKFRTGVEGVVYLDDALQIGISRNNCDYLLMQYLSICAEINLPMSHEKTMHAASVIVFLGTLLDGDRLTIGVPEEKIAKAQNQLDYILGSKKVTVLHMQRITGLLNFFCRAIVPGRAFTRRLYNTYSTTKLKQHHHLRVTGEIKLDLGVWVNFLRHGNAVSRPFVDFDGDNFVDIPFTSDAAKSPLLGYSACYWDKTVNKLYYCFNRWDSGFLETFDPSVQFLELYALTVGILLFSAKLKNSRVRIWCDNQAVIQIVNKGASSCKHCMILVRVITLTALFNNTRYQVEYLKSEDNVWSDYLSRMKEDKFLAEVPANVEPVELNTPSELLPVAKFYKHYS